MVRVLVDCVLAVGQSSFHRRLLPPLLASARRRSSGARAGLTVAAILWARLDDRYPWVGWLWRRGSKIES